MANEQTFRSPGFFEREIDLSQRVQAPLGTPAGFVGTAEKGPAFIPVTVGSFPDFKTRFGGLDAKRFGPYAVNEFLKHRSAVTYLRVLGAGSNDTSTHIETTRVQGTVRSAGFVVDGQAASPLALGERETGGVVFIAALHSDRAGEAFGFPVFTDNDSFGASTTYIVRGMVMLASGTRMLVLDGDENVTAGFQDSDDAATPNADGKFKLLISSSATGYATSDGFTGLRIFTASLNPTNSDYIAKVLNTNPDRFNVEEHLLYADFSVEDELMTFSTASGSVMLLSGSGLTSATSGDTSETFSDLFGRFDTRFTTPKTTKFISQPFGDKEFNLFHFEAISDGEWANTSAKVSIANIRKSTDAAYKYGTFAVQIRKFDDTDLKPEILEQFPVCSLDPSSENYIGRVIGDVKASFKFDADQEDERRIVVSGKFPNRSSLVRVVIDRAVEDRAVPEETLPFGFRGPEVLNTSDRLGDPNGTVNTLLPRRLIGYITGDNAVSGSVIPPLPFTFKVTRGAVSDSPSIVGTPGIHEVVDGRLYWGVKTTRVPQTGSLTDAVLNPNVSSVTNPLVKSYTKFHGIAKLDALVTGSWTDDFNNNKFTLARVALPQTAVADITGSAAQHMRETAYIRNGDVSGNDYTIVDSLGAISRVTLGTLVNLTSSVEFNRFTEFAKFTNIMYGGFDGVNILDTNASRLNDQAASSDTGGGAASDYTSPGLTTNVAGTGLANNAIASHRSAVRIMTDEMTVDTNLFAIPGIRDSFITDYAAERTRDYGLAMYVMDPVEYDEDGNRLFDTDTTKPDVKQTSEEFDSRAIDNSYAATYFPDVIISDDDNNGRRVKVPGSVAALGALAFNDRVGFPWYAPAGFNRAGLDFVSNVDVRLKRADRDTLYDARLNPIATFPSQGGGSRFVIFGQKTLKSAASALDRVNVRRMLIEAKRIVARITREGFVFEQNTPQTRARWVSQVTPRLALIQVQAGIESFRVVMDESNNTVTDVENNRLRGSIRLVPTRTVEYIAIDFIVTSTGVSFLE